MSWTTTVEQTWSTHDLDVVVEHLEVLKTLPTVVRNVARQQTQQQFDDLIETFVSLNCDTNYFLFFSRMGIRRA